MKLNHDRIRSKLDDISRSLSRLRKFTSMRRAAFLADEDSQDIARSRLITAMEAALNICFHVAAKRLHRIPDDYAQCFLLLAEAGLIPPELAERLSLMARFRNRLVHLYWDVDYSQVYDMIIHDLDDLERFCHAMAVLLYGGSETESSS